MLIIDPMLRAWHNLDPTFTQLG